MIEELEVQLSGSGGSINIPFSILNQEDLFCRLDAFYSSSGAHSTLLFSDRLRGALYAMGSESRKHNPDWMAEASHSLREILYPFSKKNSGIKLGMNREEALVKFGSIYEKRDIQELGQVYDIVENIAHHNFEDAGESFLIGGSKGHSVEITELIFEEIVEIYSRVLFDTLRRQIDLHTEISKLLEKEVRQVVRDNVLKLFLNRDARDYFFSKADARWLTWLRDNSFFDVLKESSKDPHQIAYSMPELSYLLRMSEDSQNSSLIADIILDTPISQENFNPEVIDRFQRIVAHLDAQDIARVVPKILSDQWPLLMSDFNQFGFEYKEMLQKLADARDYQSILALAKATLSVRSKKEDEKYDYGSRSPFYFRDFSESGILGFLTELPVECLDDAFKTVREVLVQVVGLGDVYEEEGMFTLGETYLLWDVDFFELKQGEKEHLSSSRDNVQELCATVATLLARLVSTHSGEESYLRKLSSEYISTLPNSRSMWRLRLFFLTLAPEFFHQEIREEAWRIFGVHYGEVVGDSYEVFLYKTFGTLPPEDKEEFVAKIIETFSGDVGDAEKVRRIIIKPICLCIKEFLSADQLHRLTALVGDLSEAYVVGQNHQSRIRGGMITPQPAGSDADWNRPVADILVDLQGAWTPENLLKTYSENDSEEYFLKPVNANGVGDRLNAEIQKRPSEYLQAAQYFFDIERLSAHYTYSFFQGVRDLMKTNTSISAQELDTFLVLYDKIRRVDEERLLMVGDREKGTFWSASWDSVRYAMADALKVTINNTNIQEVLFVPGVREHILELLEYLLSNGDPSPENESSRYTPEQEGYSGTDPYTVAINSTRGRAFEAFVSFVFKDGERLKKEDSLLKIEQDVKVLYQRTLSKESTQAIRFLFGHYLATFYYRDEEWIRGLLGGIFPEDITLFIATCEGYLSNNLYQEMFHDPAVEKEYERIVLIPEAQYPQRKYFREVPKGLATHLALAYMYYTEFTLETPLFQLFWEKQGIEAHKEFISFIGRHCIARDNDSVPQVEKIGKEKLKTFWDWCLTDNHAEAEALDGFGFWVNQKGDIFNDNPWLATKILQTLELTKGSTEWNYGMMHRLPDLTEAAPKQVLEILELHLLSERNEDRKWPYVDKDLESTFEKLARTPETKEEVKILVSKLIEEFGKPYWPLKDILEE